MKGLICVTTQIAGKPLFRVGSSKLTSVSTQGRNLLSAQRTVSHHRTICSFQNKGQSSTGNVCTSTWQRSIKASDFNLGGASREGRSHSEPAKLCKHVSKDCIHCYLSRFSVILSVDPSVYNDGACYEACNCSFPFSTNRRVLWLRKAGFSGIFIPQILCLLVGWLLSVTTSSLSLCVF